MLNTTLYSTDLKIEGYKTDADFKTETYKDINDSILEKLIYFKKMQEDTDTVKSSNSFL